MSNAPERAPGRSRWSVGIAHQFTYMYTDMRSSTGTHFGLAAWVTRCQRGCDVVDTALETRYIGEIGVGRAPSGQVLPKSLPWLPCGGAGT